MRRREFIALLGAAIARPRVAHARNTAGIARIGYLSPEPITPANDVLPEGLRDLGWIASAEVVGPTSNAFRRLRSNWRASR